MQEEDSAARLEWQPSSQQCHQHGRTEDKRASSVISPSLTRPDTRPQPHQISHCSLPAGLERTPGVMHRKMGLSQRSRHSDGGHKQGSESPEKLNPSTVQLTESIPHTNIWPSAIRKLGPRQLTGRSTVGCSKVKLKMLHFGNH